MAKTDQITLTQTRIANGWWEGVLGGAKGGSDIEAWYEDRQIAGIEVTPLPGKAGQFGVRVPIPAFVVNEGVQTVQLRLGDMALAQFTLIAGASPDEDLRAEVSQLRAELDLLKRAFRRHCAETSA